MQKSLFLIRGVPGSGKSTMANLLSENGKYPVLSIDSYFTNPKTGEYKFDYKQNHFAYANCEKQTESALEAGHSKVFVDNTFVFEWEMEPYFKLAQKHNYRLFCIIAENYHEGKNIHEINENDVAKMAAKFKVKLF